MAVNRLLIVRTSAIGDVVFASPFAAAVKRTYPQAHLAWLVEPGIDQLLAADSCIDELILWPKAEWQRLWAEKRLGELLRRVREFRRMLRAKRFDVAIDMQSLLKSGLLAWLSGAPRRIGLGSREGSQWLMTEVVPKGGALRRISSEYLYLAERLGLHTGEFLPRLCIADAAEAKARALMAEHGLAPGNFAAFAPFTTRDQKHWFEDAWQILARRVRDELGLAPAIMGGPADRAAAERIAAATPGAVQLAGLTRLPEAAALIRQAGLLVGRQATIAQLKQHPLARAVRADKLCLAGMAATLTHYLTENALTEIPIWRMIARPVAEIGEEADTWAARLQERGIRAEVVDGRSTVGGGSLPGTSLPSRLVAIHHTDLEQLATRLRQEKIPVIGRIQDGRFLIDPRTILPEQVEFLLQSLVNCAME